MQTLNPHAVNDQFANNSANFNPGDLKHATYVKKPSAD